MRSSSLPRGRRDALPWRRQVAAAPATVFVAGATGQTGRRVLERLAAKGGSVVAGVRDTKKAEKTLCRRGVDRRPRRHGPEGRRGGHAAVRLAEVGCCGHVRGRHSADSKGVTHSIASFVPGNPLKMDAQAHAVDNLGTVALVDAAKKAGVKKVVMVSSILTNGRAWGQENSPGFQVTNAFGHVLDEKIVAEKYLRASGLDYTIVRPGGLKA